MTSPAVDRSRLPIPDRPFTGTIGRTYLESEEAWLEVPKPPAGAPNVVLIVLDDVEETQLHARFSAGKDY